MRGHESIIAMRLRGRRPALVWMHDDPECADLDWPLWRESLPYPNVLLSPEDSPARVDLRFVVGLPVMVSFHDVIRMQRMVLACEAAGASSVIGLAGAVVVTTQGDQSWRN